MPSFRWLHISDWHQRKGKDRQDREIILRKLQDDVKNTMSRFDKISEIDAIIFSGDIAFSGKEEEYALANTHLIEPLKKTVGLDVPIFFVAGNHDIDWGTVEATLPDVLTRLDGLSEEEREKALANPEDIVEFKKPFAEFYKFARRHGQTFSADGIHSVMTVPLKRRLGEAGKKKVALIGLNSAWASARYKLSGKYDPSVNDPWDYGKLRPAEDQLRKAMEEAEEKGSDFDFIVMHHPIYWLDERDQPLFDDIVGAKARILLHGHEHRPRVNAVTGSFGDLLVIPAGALYERREPTDFRHVSSYNFGVVDLSSYTGEIYLRRWSESHNWVADETYWRDGLVPFFIPRQAKTIEKREVRRSLVESQRRYLNRAYERGAAKLRIDLKHSLKEIDDEVFIRAQITYEYRLQAGDDQSFTFRLGPNNATRLHPNQHVKDAAFKILEIQVGSKTLNLTDRKQVKIIQPSRRGGGITADESDQFIQYEVTISRDPVTVQYSYEILETLNGVWYFLANRFVDELEFNFEAAPRIDGLPEMNYEPIPIGNLGELKPHVGARAGIVLQNSELTFPDQGYLIHWYAKRYGATSRKVPRTKKPPKQLVQGAAQQARAGG